MDNKENIDTQLMFDSFRIILAISVGLGSIFTSFYFMSINYFPQNDINAYISIFVYISTLCLLIVGIIPSLSLFAAVLWVRNVFGNPNINQWLLKPEDVETACNISVCNPIEKSSRSEKIARKIQWDYAVSTAITILVLYAIQHTYKPTNIIDFMIPIAAIVVTIAFIAAPAFVWDRKKRTSETIRDHASYASTAKNKKNSCLLFALGYAWNTIASSLILYIAITLTLSISPSNSAAYTLLIGETIIILSAYWMTYATEYNNKLKGYLIYFATFITIILLLTNEKLANLIIKNSKLGSLDTSIFVDYDTCNMFQHLGKKLACNKNGSTEINKITIKWKGIDQYITFKATDPKTNKESEHYIILPSSAIKGTGR